MGRLARLYKSLPVWDCNFRKTIGEGTFYKLLPALHSPDGFKNPNFLFYFFRAKELGGGTVIDMGTYCCQFASLVFSGLSPVKIVASGHLNTSGADDSSSATIIYPNGKTATLMTHSQVNFPCEAIVIGTKGSLKVNTKIVLKKVNFKN